MNLGREAQLLIEPAFFWFVICGGTALVILAILRLIEFFSAQRMLFTKAKKAKDSKEAMKLLDQ